MVTTDEAEVRKWLSSDTPDHQFRLARWQKTTPRPMIANTLAKIAESSGSDETGLKIILSSLGIFLIFVFVSGNSIGLLTPSWFCFFIAFHPHLSMRQMGRRAAMRLAECDDARALLPLLRGQSRSPLSNRTEQQQMEDALLRILSIVTEKPPVGAETNRRLCRLATRLWFSEALAIDLNDQDTDLLLAIVRCLHAAERTAPKLLMKNAKLLSDLTRTPATQPNRQLVQETIQRLQDPVALPVPAPVVTTTGTASPSPTGETQTLLQTRI